jgi:tRNA pseudouridine38-40 synthase
MRLAAGVEYDGSGFAGWQIQPHAQTVQGAVEAALSRIADHPIRTICAGRTDAGVHALGQVIHFDSDAPRAPHAWVFGANSLLPDSVSLRWVKAVPDEFNARRSARSRRYRYVIHNCRARSGLLGRRAFWFAYPLDAARMQASAACLLGEHDFSAFRAAECQSRTPIRRVDEVMVTRQGDWIAIEIEANAFLHHMVRNIVGVLMAVGQGARPMEWTAGLLAGRDRSLGGVTAGPEGLYFMRVRYDEALSLPAPDPVPSLLLR